MKFLFYAVLYAVQLVAAIVLAIIANLFGWAIALFVDTETGHLPYLLKWFETVDASCYDVQWVAEHPAWSKWRIATTWIMRNPAYGFCAWCRCATPDKVTAYGNVNIADGERGVAGWFLITDATGRWNFSYVINIGSNRCMRGEWGWYLLPVAKNDASLNTGLLQTSPFRFYAFGVKGN